MNPIITPLKRGMTGQRVADLQDALGVLLDRRLLLGEDENTRLALAPRLQRERTVQTFDTATAKLVGIFQETAGQPGTGEVDEATAKALNALLAQLGLLHDAVATAPVDPPRSRNWWNGLRAPVTPPPSWASSGPPW